MIAALWNGHDGNLLFPTDVETKSKFVKFDNLVKSVGGVSGRRRKGSQAAASRHLRRSLQSVNRSLLALESAVGVELIKRSTRKTEPTAAGRASYERIQPALAEILQARSEADLVERKAVEIVLANSRPKECLSCFGNLRGCLCNDPGGSRICSPPD